MKEKIMTFLFVGILFILSIFIITTKDKSISLSERRYLMTSDTLKTDFFANLDDYLTDQFPFRDNFISLNAYFERYLLKINDSFDVYLQDNYLIDKNYPENPSNIDAFIQKINYLNDNYLSNSNTFYTIIPDKGYFLDEKKFLKLNYSDIISKVTSNINLPYIDLTDSLKLTDYYQSDIHIKQTSYPKIIQKFSEYLDFDYYDFDYQKNTLTPFLGSSYPKAPSKKLTDDLVYLSNDIIDTAKVWHLDYGYKSVYDKEKLTSVDPYNVFLSGPSSIVEITNNKSNSKREIIILRDSFASSFTPLLIPYYHKITLIDLRYINLKLISNYVDFDNKDVLIAYSTLILNESNLLKIDYNS